MPLFAGPSPWQLEKGRKVRALMRMVRQHPWTEEDLVLPAIRALGRLGDPRAAVALRAGYEQQAECCSGAVLAECGVALAALRDLHALRPLATVMAADVNQRQRVVCEECESERAALAVRYLGTHAFDAVAESFDRRAVPRHLRASAVPMPSPVHGALVLRGQPRASYERASLRTDAMDWLTVESTYLIAGASGDPRAIGVLTGALLSNLGVSEGVAAAALGLGWSGSARAVHPLIAALFTGLIMERCEAVRERDHVVPRSIQLLLYDHTAEADAWRLRPHRLAPPADAAQGDACGTARSLWVSAAMALGRLRYQQAAVPLLAVALERSTAGCGTSAWERRVIAHSVRQTGSLPIMREVAASIERGCQLDAVLLIKQARSQFGVEVSGVGPFDWPKSLECGPLPPNAQVLAPFPTPQLCILKEFATNQHLGQLVADELARRAIRAT